MNVELFKFLAASAYCEEGRASRAARFGCFACYNGAAGN